MRGQVGHILIKALRITMASPLLWLAVLAVSLVPIYPKYSVSFLLNCGLLAAQIALTSFGTLASPFLVLQASVSAPADLATTWKFVKSSLPRLLGFYFIIVIPLLCSAATWYYLILAPDRPAPSIAYAILAKYLIVPCLGAIFALAIAGLAIHRLNGFQALVNAISISFNNILPVLILAILFVLLTLVPQTLLRLVQGGPSQVLEAFTSFQAIASSYPSTSEYTFWHLVQSLAYLPLSVYQSAAWVLLYISATDRTPYPGLPTYSAA
jgi:hypothetical protein